MSHTPENGFVMDALSELAHDAGLPIPPYMPIQAIGISRERLIETICHNALERKLLLPGEAPTFCEALERSLTTTSTTTGVLEIAPIELVAATTTG